MNHLIRTTLVLAAGFLVSPLGSHAATMTPEISARTAVVARMQMQRVRATAGMRSSQVENATQPGTPMPNPLRAYPPSCAADPLPTQPSGLIFTKTNFSLAAVNAQGESTSEPVTISIWRLPCSSTGLATPYNPNGYYNAITLMRIDRTDASSATTVPFFPLVQISQGNDFNDTQGNPLLASLVRSAAEPNTVVSEVAFGSPVSESTTYVLENYPYQGWGYFTFSDAFVLRIDPYAQGLSAVDLSIPAYEGAGSTAMAIDGYVSSAWYDSAHSGEGLVLEVLDNANSVAQTVFASWYTYDALGLPYWLVAQGVVQPGATELVDAPVYYYTNGGFAGDFGAHSDRHAWGTLSLSFPNCNTVELSYSGSTSDPNGPSGSGNREWRRVANVNGLTCE